MIKIPDLSEMLDLNNIVDMTEFSCFQNEYDSSSEKYILNLAKSINIESDLLSTYNNWLKINNKYFYFKSNNAFQELLIEKLFEEIKVRTVKHQIVKFNDEIGIISQNYRKPNLLYYYFSEIITGYNSENNFIEINNSIKKAMKHEDYENYLNQMFKIIAVDILFGQYDRWEYNVFFAKSKEHICLAPMFDNGCIFLEDYNDILIYGSCFGTLTFSTDYEDYFTTNTLRKFSQMVCSLEKALNFDLSKIFDNLELEYKIKICKEIRTQIQNYYDIHRKMVEKTLKFAK